MTSTLKDQPLSELMASIAKKTPTPGGGAVASVAAALAAALTKMVVRFSQGKKKLEAHDQLHTTALQTLSTLASETMDLAQADVEAYARLTALWSLEKHDPKRVAAWDAAVHDAIGVPHRIMTAAMRLLELLEQLCGATNALLKSDLAIAAVLAEAAVRAGGWNVRINLPLLEVADEAARLEAVVDSMTSRAQTLCRSIETACR